MTLGLSPLANQRFERVPGAEAGDDLNLFAEPREVIGRGDDAAGEYFAATETAGDDVFLGRLAHGLGVEVLVDDRLADQEDTHFADAFDRGQGARQAIAPP